VGELDYQFVLELNDASGARLGKHKLFLRCYGYLFPYIKLFWMAIKMPHSRYLGL